VSLIVKSEVRRGAFDGLFAWAAYGIVEYFIVVFVQGVATRHYVFQPWHWWMNLLVLALFAALGLLAGAVSGVFAAGVLPRLRWFAGPPADAVRRALPLLCLIAAYLGANIYLTRGYGLLPFTIPVCLLLLAAQSVSCLPLGRRLTLLTNPWTTSALLVAIPWMLKTFFATDPSLLKKITSVVILAVSVPGIVWLLRKAGARLGGPLARLALAAAVVFALSVFAHQPLVRGRPRMDTPPPRGNPPNIVWIVMDTVRADHLSVYGYPRKTTANLEQLRQEATFYANAIAPSDFTLSSHASMFTGLYPSRHGAHYTPENPHGQPLAASYRTIAEILSENGYFTTGIAANQAYLAADFGMNQGFRVYNAWASLPLLGPMYPYALRTATRPLLQYCLSTTEMQTFLRDAESINQSAFEFLEASAGQPGRFFLFLNYMDAHFPRKPPKGVAALYPGINESFNWNDYFALEQGVLGRRRTVTETERVHLTAQYDAAIHYLDLQLGNLFTRFKQLGLYDDCLLIVTSDHGEAFGEKDMFAHGVSVYQDQVHVPLIIKYPKTRQSSVVTDYVSVADLMPTILDLLGYEVPSGLDGRSLLRPGQQRAGTLISESHSFGRYRNIHARFRRVERAVFLGPAKLITSTSGKQELYEIHQDPAEEHDLYSTRNVQVRELSEMLQAWLSLVHVSRSGPVKQRRETLERLRSLGYLQ
jgi:arylsulfatase A-like enzyme